MLYEFIYRKKVIKIELLAFIISLKININYTFDNLKFYNNYLYVEELEPWKKYIQKEMKNNNYKRKK